MSLSFRASRRLSDLADEAAERAGEHVADEVETAAETEAHDLVIQDELVAEAIESEYRLDQQANERRKSLKADGLDPRQDAILSNLREARQAANEAANQRVEELVQEALDADHLSADTAEEVEA